jgi:hypothetical protein
MTAIRESPHAVAAPSPQRRDERAVPLRADVPDAPSPFGQLVRGLARESDRGEATIRGVLDPGRAAVAHDPASLLALQAGIYRYGETVDLAAKLVDKASSSVKTVLQGQ